MHYQGRRVAWSCFARYCVPGASRRAIEVIEVIDMVGGHSVAAARRAHVDTGAGPPARGRSPDWSAGSLER